MAKRMFIITSVVVTILLIFTMNDTVLAAANLLPVIAIWYEQDLRFGQLGNAQTHINVLGNVSDSDGSIVSLSYQLNGGSPVTLSVGPDGTRLVNAGDFNAAIPTSSLKNGNNDLVFTAVDNSGGKQTKAVVVRYTSGKVWPMPYSTQWSSAGSIADQAQVVDGKWSIGVNGIQPTVFGYDRLVAVGDVGWKDFEILVPITVRGFYPDAANPTDAGGVGIIARWRGHTGSGQPPNGWTQIGAYGYYSNRLKALALRLNGDSPITQNYAFQLNTTYLFKLRAETVSQGGRYSFKLWEQGMPEPAWNSSAFSNIVNVVDSNGDLPTGSILFVAHRADATFGDVTICSLTQTYPLTINTSGSGAVKSTPVKANYNCGEGVTLTAQPSPGWVFAGWSGDLSGQSNSASFNVTRPMSVVANFALAQELPYSVYLPTVVRD